MSGALHIVGTPIGNMADLSPRAVATLTSADLIACEDTRRTGRLLQLAGIPKRPLTVANEHTERSRAGSIIDQIAGGASVALVSDAGMPGISDPGMALVNAVIEAGLTVDVIPGPTAISAALVLSGLPMDRYVFEGFLPRKGTERTAIVRSIVGEKRTVVLYESPKRVVATLAALAEACGPERPVAVGRELTKLHEDVVRGSLASVRAHFVEHEPRGEFVIVVGGRAVDDEWSDASLIAALRDHLASGATKRDAVRAVMEASGCSKRRVYDLSLTLLQQG